MTGLPFIKMHGLGNDFVVLDARKRPIALTDAATKAIADRKTGVGCDQLIVLEPPVLAGADAVMRIRNADGGEVEACGNAARCIAHLLMDARNDRPVVLDTTGGRISATAAGDGRVTVDMGPANTGWREIPLARQMDTLHLDYAQGPLKDPAAVNVGNPHVVFFVEDAEAIDLERLGALIEHDPLFPERINVEVVEVKGSDMLRMRVWERGVGITRACGTGACASLVAAARRGLTGRRAHVFLDGGALEIEWLENNHVLMTGPVAQSFTGTLDESLFKN
jgi:diaminopimelate epimerase